jgi:hypothetical protein
MGTIFNVSEKHCSLYSKYYGSTFFQNVVNFSTAYYMFLRNVGNHLNCVVLSRDPKIFNELQ